MTGRALADAGHDVYAGMRDIAGRNAKAAQEAADYANEQSVDLHAVEMDVLEQASVDAAVQTIISTEERLDVIVHNAGHMVLGPLESFTTDQLVSIYDTNVLSTQRLNRAALPHLRNQRDGLVVWVGSTSTRGGNRGNIRGVRGGRGGQPVRRNQPRARAPPPVSVPRRRTALFAAAPRIGSLIGDNLSVCGRRGLEMLPRSRQGSYERRNTIAVFTGLNRNVACK